MNPERYTKEEMSMRASEEIKRDFKIQPQKRHLTSLKNGYGAVTFGKVGRNDACPCGSKKKYKKCCMKAGPLKKMEMDLDREREAKGISKVALSEEEMNEIVKETKLLGDAMSGAPANDIGGLVVGMDLASEKDFSAEVIVSPDGVVDVKPI